MAPEYTDPDGRARIEFSRLRAVAATAAAIPFKGGAREPYMSWLTKRKTEVVYDEPGGRWMLSDRSIWDAHSRVSFRHAHRRHRVVRRDERPRRRVRRLAAVLLDWRNRLQGEYLRLHPAGQHAEEAVTVVKDTVDRLSAPAPRR